MLMQEPELSQSKESAPPATKALRALLVEDSETDAALVVRSLEQSYQVHFRRVQDAAGMEEALRQEAWDVVLCNYGLPGFGVFPAMELLARRQLDLPFLVVSGEVGEDVAVEAIKAGAHDYIRKDRLTRLAPAIEREIGRAQTRRDHDRLLRKAAWLAAIVDSMAEAVIGADLDGKITSWNAGAERLYGVPAPEAIGSALVTLAPPALQAETRQMLEAIRKGEPVADFETTILTRRDGTPVDVASAVSAVKDPTGRIIGIAIVASDITERKEAEREHRKMIAELKETLAQVRQLHGLLPICASCKKIRDEKGNWQALESYISGHSEAEFSHSICPTCAQSLYPDFVAKL
jgi:PAS domain S-box-containing protein